MRIFFFLITSFFILASAQAQNRTTSVRAYLDNFESRFERAASQETVSRRPVNLGVGYYSAKYSVLLEVASFSENTGNATSSFQRTHQDILTWFRYHAWNLRSVDQSILTNIYFGAGAGAYQERVETRFSGTSRTDKGNAKFMSGGTMGFELSLFLSRDFALVSALEGRVLMSSDFDPNPMWGAIARFGVAFPL